MVVQHNLSAMNANRMLGITQGTLSKSTEKLASGYKVNRAADDAAGLSISEKMRKQIRGLTQASLNAEDGISAVQTAEGALTEVHDMLQRMNELAVKSANGTNSINDRAYIQDEIDQLVTEIDRVAETTKFNETYLLKGDSNATKGYTYAYNTWATTVAAKAEMDADTSTGLDAEIDFATNVTAGDDDKNAIVKTLRDQGLSVSISYSAAEGDAVYSVALNGSAADNYKVVTTDAAGGKFQILNADDELVCSITASGGAVNSGEKKSAVITADADTCKASMTGGTGANKEVAQYYDESGNKISANALGNYFSVDSTGAIKANGSAKSVYDAIGNALKLTPDEIASVQNQTGALTMKFQVGADSSANNKITVNIDAMTAKGLGVNGLKVDGANSDNADNAVNVIAEAIQKVSTQRSALGAVQNRLEHTINNLDNVVENTTAAESQIRDTDMATEMVKYSNANILSQAGQSMLAQANQSNQGVLSLLG